MNGVSVDLTLALDLTGFLFEDGASPGSSSESITLRFLRRAFSGAAGGAKGIMR